MKFKNKAERNGYIFGNVCRFVGALSTLITLFLLPNEKIYINKRMIIPAIISFLVFYYGFWRTGGTHNHDNF